jgi:hypothetical protein
MLRTIFMIGLLRAGGLFVLKFFFGILPGILGLIAWLFFLAVMIAIVGGVIYLAIGSSARTLRAVCVRSGRGTASDRSRV